jgi:1,6-anhydro-N-acetylmuramate kinase
MNRLIAGCMTGTSLDSLDVALVEISGLGLSMKPRLVRAVSHPLGKMARGLRAMATQRRVTAGQIARHSLLFSRAHLAALEEIAGDDRLDLIVVHGQTIYHEERVTWQLFNPWPVVAAMRVPVVFDLRWADMAGGGQGAPITPLADHIVFRDSARMQVVVNLGGFANYTWLPATQNHGEAALASIRGGDICVCNQLLDAVAMMVMNQPYDADGAVAMSGRIVDEPFQLLMQILLAQADGGRSLGTGDEVFEWVTLHRDDLSAADLARTACAAIAQTICRTIGPADHLILAGGGVFNLALLHEIRHSFIGPVVLSDELGVPVQYREAMEMAILGALAADGVPITLPQVTGRANDVARAGCWVYPS